MTCRTESPRLATAQRAVRLLAVAAVALCAAPAAAWLPDRAECIAPANPGGGWDTICRASSGVLQKTGLMKTNLYVTNMPGGSGAVAIANVITKRKADGGLLVAASNSLTFTMAMNRTPHSYDDVTPLAQIAAEYGGFFVRADSKYKTLQDVIGAMKADPRAVTFAGGSAPGSLDHIKVALLAKAIGVEPTKAVYVPFQGGGEAMTSLLGGHTEVAAMDVSEAAPQLEAGKIRCLAVMSDKRSSKFKDVPTTQELGVNVSFPIWRGLYMAPGAPADAVAFWTDTVKKMTASPAWKAELDKLGWEPAVRTGDDFKQFVKGERARYQALLRELGFLKS
jgi:putative tricarboxylic transport membrane protein